MQDLVRVENVTAGYNGLEVVRNITFSLKKREILGIVGESGCGKSTLLKALFPVRGMRTEVFSGTVRVDGLSISDLSKDEKRKIWGEQIAYIFQNPESSFHPSRRIRVQMYEAMQAHRKMSVKEMDERIEKAMRAMGLSDVSRICDSYPFELSGGMAQRVAIATAVLLEPILILADEPTSALDTTIQKQVIDELLSLREKLGTAMIVISHNMGVVSKMADYIGVMYAGRLVEYGHAADVLEAPNHPYTKALIEAVPKIGGGIPVGLAGAPPKFKELGNGCGFISRCPYRSKACEGYRNEVYVKRNGRRVLCLLEDQ